jgi:hypothetical protein
MGYLIRRRNAALITELHKKVGLVWQGIIAALSSALDKLMQDSKAKP